MNTFTENNSTYIGTLIDDDDTEYKDITNELEQGWEVGKDEFIKTYLKVNPDLEYMTRVNGNMITNNSNQPVDLTKLSKMKLLEKCEELGFAKCKSKNKGELIDLINIKIHHNTKVDDDDKTLVGNVDTTNTTIFKPILKWVGGKTQILDKLMVEFPSEINNYHEIFLGGGSVLFALLSYIKNGSIKVNGNIYAYDINEPLIYMYKNIQTHHTDLYYETQKIITIYNSCTATIEHLNRTAETIEEATKSKENYYYWIRSKYNKLSSGDKKTTVGSAMFIFLNKTCFRGVFRVGPHGFNVPYGNNLNPEIINKEHLDNIHRLIQNVIFKCDDFNVSLNNIAFNDYVYIDPPYAKENATSFVGYTENGFNLENHHKLFKLIHKLTDSNKKVMLSNADVSLVRDSFTNLKYNIHPILCKRTIHSKNPEVKAKEVIIKNY